MDIKIDGLSFDVLTEALNQAKEGRLHILKEMSNTIKDSRSELKGIRLDLSRCLFQKI